MGSNFYGGRDGQPFIIKQVFSSLTEMLNSSQIDYQEYALLNYANRNHPLHGALYRKNFDINSDRELNDYSLNNNGEWIDGEKKKAKGFYYIGSLKGSRGSAGNINIVNETQYQNELNNANNSPSVTVIENVKNGEINLVNPDVLNKITWKSFTKNDLNNDNNSEAFISFQIPNHVFNVKTESINSDQAPSASTSIDPNNQFKHTINFKIPKGIKGSSFTNLRILTSASAAVNGTVYKTDNSVYCGGYPNFAYDFIDYSTNPAGVN